MVVLIALSAAASAPAADRDRPADGTFIATTGRIVSIDVKSKMLRVRGSDSEPARNFAQTKPRSSAPVITLPGRLTIRIPIRVERTPSKPAPGTPNLDEYTVVITSKTLIQDGGEPIRLEDFKEGEVVSVHGMIKGTTLTASRISKWS